MKLVLISLDLVVALPLLFASMTALLGYAYNSQNYVEASSVHLARIESLYMNSSVLYDMLTASFAFNAMDTVQLHAGSGAEASLYDSNASAARGCALQYACRVVVISGRAYTLVFR